MAHAAIGPRLPLGFAVAALACSIGSATIVAVSADDTARALRRWTSAPAAESAGQYDYSLSVRVRPALFWITRDGVGTGRIVRAGSGQARVLALLIGSDPARAPMRINRWGYVTEMRTPKVTHVLGVMTTADEQSVEEAGRSVTGDDKASHHFKAIRASIGDGESSAEVVRASFAEDFTLRDLDAVLTRLPEGGPPTARLRVPADARPGFLGAVADLVDQSVAQAAAIPSSERPTRGQPARTTFAWDRGLYDLTCASRGPEDLRLNGVACRGCIESEFRVHSRLTGKTQTFRLTYPGDGPMAGVPVRIVYRPRWWFEAELTLREPR